MQSESRARRFTLWHAALLLPWLVASYRFGRSFNDNSYLWHVRAGDLQVDRGEVLTTDPFSFTMAGEPWRTQSWLAELLYSVLDGIGGLSATPYLTSVAGALLFALLGLIAYRHSNSLPSVAVFLTGSSLVFAAFLNPRPAILSFPLFAGVVLASGDRRLRWVIPVLMWVWASIHGSFALGLVFLFLRFVLARSRGRKGAAEFLAAGLPTLLTAHGVGTLQILWNFARNRESIELMSEWRTPDLISFSFFPLLLGLFGIIWLAQQQRLRKGDWLLVLPFVVIALSASRSVPPAWIALAPVIGKIRVPIKPSAIGGPFPAVLAVLLLAFPFAISGDEDIDEGRLPVESSRYLQGGRVFHDDAAGGWLIYQQWPARKVYVDDRAELFGDQMLRFSEVRSGESSWRAEFEKWSIDEALLKVDEPMVEILQLADWQIVYRDEDFVLLRPRST